jgi:beta-lactamase class D
MQDMLWPSHGQDLTPALWMSVSAVWYSQHITQQMDDGIFQGYLAKFDYGNQDMTNGGLTNCWISRSLEISAREQTEFIGKLISKDAHEKLNVSPGAVLHTKEIMQITGSPISTLVVPAGALPDGWKLSGKTGGWGRGWFVGWAQKDDQKLTFACYVDPKKEGKGPVGRDIALPMVLERLSQIIAEKKL